MLKNKRGFTLIELIVVIGILGVIAAIAVPIYSSYRTQAYRTAAKAALVEGAQNMERLFTRTNSYVGATVGDTAAGDQIQQWTEGRKYQLSVPVLTATTFTLQATPTFTENKCGFLKITQKGEKLSQFSGSCVNWCTDGIPYGCIRGIHT